MDLVSQSLGLERRNFTPIDQKPVAIEVTIKVMQVSKEVAGCENDSIVF